MSAERLPVHQEHAFAAVEFEVIDDERMTAFHLAVYLALAYHANRRGEDAFPSFQTIADKAHCSRRMVISCIKDLTKWGFVHKRARRDDAGDATSNGYFLPSMRRRYEAREKAKRGGGAQHAPPVVHSMHQGSAQGAPYPDPSYPLPLDPEKGGIPESRTSTPPLAAQEACRGR